MIYFDRLDNTRMSMSQWGRANPRTTWNRKPCGFIDGPFIPQDTQSNKAEYIESA